MWSQGGGGGTYKVERIEKYHWRLERIILHSMEIKTRIKEAGVGWGVDEPIGSKH